MLKPGAGQFQIRERFEGAVRQLGPDASEERYGTALDKSAKHKIPVGFRPEMKSDVRQPSIDSKRTK